MIQSSSQIKDILFDCLNSMSENPWIYTDQDNQFFRIIRLILPNGSVEYIYTNLPKEDFTLAEIRELYNRRWGIMPISA